MEHLGGSFLIPVSIDYLEQSLTLSKRLTDIYTSYVRSLSLCTHITKQGFYIKDYGASVAESRELTAKYGELKLQSFFLRSFPDLRMTDLIGMQDK